MKEAMTKRILKDLHFIPKNVCRMEELVSVASRDAIYFQTHALFFLNRYAMNLYSCLQTINCHSFSEV